MKRGKRPNSLQRIGPRRKRGARAEGGPSTARGRGLREAIYQAAIATSADGFWLCDHSCRILEVNDAYVNRSGYSREELLALRIPDLEAKESAADTAAHIEKITRLGSDIFETLHRAKDGTVWPVEVNASYSPLDGGRFFVHLRDINRRKRSERLLAARFRLSTLAERTGLDLLMQATLDEAELFTGSTIGFFHLVDDDQEHLTLQAWSTNTLKTMCTAEGKGRHYPISQAGIWVDCFHQRRPVIHDAPSMSHRPGMPEGHAPVTRELTLPILRGDKVKAIIGVGNKTTAYTSEDIDAVSELASLAFDLVERKQAEAAQRLHENRLSLAMEATRQGWFDLNVQTGEVQVSPEYARIIAYDPHEFATNLQKWLNGIHPEDRDAVLAVYRECVQSGETRTMEYRRRTRDGAWKWLRTIGKIVETDAAGAPLRMMGTHMDISELREKEEQLRASSRRFEAVFSLVPDPTTITDIEAETIIDLNDAAARWFGRSREETIGMTTTALRLWKDPLDRQRMLAEMQARGEINDLEFRLRNGAGEVRDVLFSSRLAEFAGRQVLLTRAHDITPLKRAEEAIRENEIRLKTAQKIARLGNWQYDIGKGELWWSDELYQMFDIRQADGPVTMERFLARIHPSDWEQLKKEIESGLTHRSDYRLVLPNGRIKNIHEEIAILRDEQGAPHKYVGTAQDITERKQLEQSLRQSEELIRGIHDTVDEGFIVVDRRYQILSANRAYCQQTGLSLEHIVGRPCFEVSHKSTRPCHELGEECAVKAVFETGRSHKSLHRHEDAAGGLLYVETRAFPLKDASGEVTAAIEVIHNITERYLLEAERLKTQKLEAIGTLAGGIAHDFNNLLQGVFGFVSMARLSATAPEKVEKMLDQAEKALSLSVNLTTQLLTFAKGGKPVKKRVDLRPTIENSTKFALSGSRCDYRLHLAEGLWPTEVDEGQIGQVIQNIVMNASETMPEGGTVDISAKNIELPAGSGPAHQAGGSYIRIAIQDSGSGIPEEIRARIFDPYFTTKKKGSGLGLATSYSIIKNHGGSIDVVSAVGKGTTFIITLPAGKAKASAKPAVSVSTPVLKRGEKILVMDDDAMVLDVARSMLEALGHEVEVATRGEEAIAQYRRALEAGTPFDLVILDLTIKAGMGGEETVRSLRALDPMVKAVVSSGYSDDPVLSDYKSYGFAGLLSKPYSLKELRECLSAQAS